MMTNASLRYKQERRQLERKIITIAVAACVVILSILNIVDTKLTIKAENEKLKEAQIERTLSIHLGQGQCEWTLPKDAPQDTEVFSTLLAAFPGSGKRTAFMQLEGMTELRAGDDYNLSPDSVGKKFAFMKSNYPQHEGIWSFGKKMNQAILLVRNPRWALPNYQHMLHSIDWESSYKHRFQVYTMRPPIEDWIVWRELRFDAEIKKWGWFIDYWMEGGLLRDVFTNKLTTAEHFERLTQPMMYAQAELMAEQETLIDVAPSVDGHCIHDMQSCKPVAIASFERIMDPETGPSEVNRFVSAIEGKAGLNVIEVEARYCVWEELIIKGKGFIKTIKDRDTNGPSEDQYGFTLEQMGKIQDELHRVRDKYSSGDWVNDTIAQSLVEYIDSYIAENEEEMRVMS
jgi:hypothetical protein